MKEDRGQGGEEMKDGKQVGEEHGVRGVSEGGRGEGVGRG